MRADPALCFLEKVGMPDEKLLSAEQGVSDGAQDTAERWAGDGTEPLRVVQLTPGGHVRSGVVLRDELCLQRAMRGEGSRCGCEHSRQQGRQVGAGSLVRVRGLALPVPRSCRQQALPGRRHCHYQGLIHCLTQGQHGKGREQWRKNGGAAKAGGEWDSQCSMHTCCCPACCPASRCRLGSALPWGAGEAVLPVSLPWAGIAVPSTGSVPWHFCLLEHSCFLLTWTASAS